MTIKTFDVSWNGWKFNVVCGKIQSGWFMAVPNWEMCIECAPPYNVDYNSKKIENALKLEGTGEHLALSFKKAFEEEE